MMGALFLIFVRAAHDKATAPRTGLAYSPRAAGADGTPPAWCGRPEPATAGSQRSASASSRACASWATRTARRSRPTRTGGWCARPRAAPAGSARAADRDVVGPRLALDWRARPPGARCSPRRPPPPRRRRRGASSRRRRGAAATRDGRQRGRLLPRAQGGRRLRAAAARVRRHYAKGRVCSGCVRTLNELGCNASRPTASRAAARVRWPTARRTRAARALFADHHNVGAEPRRPRRAAPPRVRARDGAPRAAGARRLALRVPHGRRLMGEGEGRDGFVARPRRAVRRWGRHAPRRARRRATSPRPCPALRHRVPRAAREARAGRRARARPRTWRRVRRRRREQAMDHFPACAPRASARSAHRARARRGQQARAQLRRLRLVHAPARELRRSAQRRRERGFLGNASSARRPRRAPAALEREIVLYGAPLPSRRRRRSKGCRAGAPPCLVAATPARRAPQGAAVGLSLGRTRGRHEDNPGSPDHLTTIDPCFADSATASCAYRRLVVGNSQRSEKSHRKGRGEPRDRSLTATGRKPGGSSAPRPRPANPPSIQPPPFSKNSSTLRPIHLPGFQTSWFRPAHTRRIGRVRRSNCFDDNPHLRQLSDTDGAAGAGVRSPPLARPPNLRDHTDSFLRHRNGRRRRAVRKLGNT